jgi:hypothetical protein
MRNIYNYDEKAAYEQRYHSRSRHNKQTSCSSSNSSSSFNKQCGDFDHNSPAYSYVFYNTIEDKPLPQLPREGESRSKVRFIVEKPLPPL